MQFGGCKGTSLSFLRQSQGGLNMIQGSQEIALLGAQRALPRDTSLGTPAKQSQKKLRPSPSWWVGQMCPLLL